MGVKETSRTQKVRLVGSQEEKEALFQKKKKRTAKARVESEEPASVEEEEKLE